MNTKLAYALILTLGTLPLLPSTLGVEQCIDAGATCNIRAEVTLQCELFCTNVPVQVTTATVASDGTKDSPELWLVNCWFHDNVLGVVQTTHGELKTTPDERLQPCILGKRWDAVFGAPYRLSPAYDFLATSSLTKTLRVGVCVGHVKAVTPPPVPGLGVNDQPVPFPCATLL